MDSELFLGIPGVDIPYPKYVQDALDLVERETNRVKQRDQDLKRQVRQGEVFDGSMRSTLAAVMGTAKPDPEVKFWKVRKAQKAAQQKKRPYQQIDRADMWPSW